jgi:putative peptide zinc metalloprotease protein
VLSSPPRLRSDLTVSRQQTAEGSSCVVKDPVSGRFFRFRETEDFIAGQLDGETPLEVVRRRTEERFDASMASEHLYAFVARLEKAGLLETGSQPRKPRTGGLGRIRGSLLYLRVALLDPDQHFSRLVPRLRFFFTPRFVALSAALILLAFGTTIANWSELTQDLAGLYRLSAIPLFLAVFFVVASAHEVAHSLTCKQFGGEVHEMGFMLIYFQPALYTNVSDAWLFPERRRRLWVGLAGPWFELFIWALAAMAWRLTDVETGVHSLSLMVMAVSGVKTLVNFNPLIKLDGYYLLSDYLDIPNLRKRSFAYVGDLFKRLVGFEPTIRAEISARERRVYAVYGLVATVCSVALLAYVVVKAGGFFIDRHQPGALALFAGLVGMKSRRRFRKLFGKAADPAEPDDDDVETPLPTSSPEPALAPAPAPAPEPKRKGKRGRAERRRIVWVALAAVALVLVFLGRLELRIGGPFVVLPEENADVRAEVEGLVQEIAVEEGQQVQAGDLIARLSNHALVADLGKTESAIQETRANLRKLEAGPTAEEIAVAKAAVSRAEDRIRYAQSNVTRLRSLYDKAAVTSQEFEAAQELANTAENDLAEARGRLDLLVRRSRPEDIEASRARLESLEKQRQFLDGEVRELTVVSPVTGIVATPAPQLKEMNRQLVARGALIAKVYDFTTVMARIVVSEKEIGDVRVGQPVALRVRAHPNATFHGTVTAIATAADGIPITTVQAPLPGGSTGGAGAVSGKTFTITTRIDNRALLLKAGMTGYAKILGGQRRIVDLLVRRLARSFRVEVWSWW